MRIILQNSKIIDKSSPFDGQTKDILIENGVIIAIENGIKTTPEDTIIHLDNLHISQGWFDSSVCFGEPGLEDRETIENGLKTASKSGFTHIAVNPNSAPVIDNKSAVEFLISKAQKTATNLYPIGAFTKQSASKDMAEMYDMQNSGAVAFGDYKKPIHNANLLKVGLLYTQNFDGLLLSYPQDDSIAQNGLVHEGINSTKYGLKGIPAMAEELQIARDLFLLEYTQGKLHIPTISTKKSVELIKDAKRRGLNVTCSVSAHHLCITDDELQYFDSRNKVRPPLRTQTDIVALLEGLKEGTIDMITSDHQPITIEDKKVEFQNAKYGTIGLESIFGALNTVLDIELIIEKLTAKDRFSIPENSIKIGNKADLTFFNPTPTSTFTKTAIISTSKNSIFLNKEIKGLVYGVFANGILVQN
ncbi:MAG: dihydroorotase [Flavobacteriaceae bacterium]|nr:MAG: dihydroorotase [Flavobacteriaceae bacterium]